MYDGNILSHRKILINSMYKKEPNGNSWIKKYNKKSSWGLNRIFELEDERICKLQDGLIQIKQSIKPRGKKNQWNK